MNHFRFDNSYARLPGRFYARHSPTPVARPELIALNAGLAAELGLDPEALSGAVGVAVLAGNALPEGADPIAQAYAGHQFGGWVPRLGDGRAILLGEVIDRAGRRRDVQIKGAGQTPFSRGGDGRAWLGPVLREYLVSEAMHSLGVPTTRALAALTTGEQVMRERPLPGARLVRVASSHIRVGTFQFFAARDDTEALALLCEHAIARHFPRAGDALGLLRAAVEGQAELVAQWMALGFIHGVMNTDNAHVAGETIDYGPCAFMDDYHPARVFSSIDQFGRYAYANQPQIAQWNMAQLASALLPLIDADRNRAIAAATEAVDGFVPRYRAAWLARFRAKIGLADPAARAPADPAPAAQDDHADADAALIESLLGLMAAQRADFTRVFQGLAEGTAAAEFADPAAFEEWAGQWRASLRAAGRSAETAAQAMAAANPAIIPRNHRIEAAIDAALSGDLSPFRELGEALRTPFAPPGARINETAPLAAAPAPDEAVRRTFCGT